jgi:hypothetical protein
MLTPSSLGDPDAAPNQGADHDIEKCVFWAGAASDNEVERHGADGAKHGASNGEKDDAHSDSGRKVIVTVGVERRMVKVLDA